VCESHSSPLNGHSTAQKSGKKEIATSIQHVDRLLHVQALYRRKGYCQFTMDEGIEAQEGWVTFQLRRYGKYRVPPPIVIQAQKYRSIGQIIRGTRCVESGLPTRGNASASPSGTNAPELRNHALRTAAFSLVASVVRPPVQPRHSRVTTRMNSKESGFMILGQQRALLAGITSQSMRRPARSTLHHKTLQLEEEL